MPSDILGVVQVAGGQLNPEVIINEGIYAVEKQSGTISVAATSTTVTLTEDQSRYGLVIITGTPSADTVVQIPASMNHRLVIRNSTSGSGKLRARRVGRTTTVTIPRGCSVPIRRLVDDVAVDEFLNLNRPVAIATRITANQTISSSGAAVIFNSESLDTSGSFDTSTGVFTAPCDGLLHVQAGIAFNITADGIVRAEIQKNSGALFPNRTCLDFAQFTTGSVAVAGILQVAEGDTVRIFVIDELGNSVDVLTTSSYFMAVYLGY
jgi:hypothetical protein